MEKERENIQMGFKLANTLANMKTTSLQERVFTSGQMETGMKDPGDTGSFMARGPKFQQMEPTTTENGEMVSPMVKAPSSTKTRVATRGNGAMDSLTDMAKNRMLMVLSMKVSGSTAKPMVKDSKVFLLTTPTFLAFGLTTS